MSRSGGQIISQLISNPARRTAELEVGFVDPAELTTPRENTVLWDELVLASHYLGIDFRSLIG
jgi:hypothetical protein